MVFGVPYLHLTPSPSRVTRFLNTLWRGVQRRQSRRWLPCPPWAWGHPCVLSSVLEHRLCINMPQTPPCSPNVWSGESRALSQQRVGYCWPTYFNPRRPTFLHEIFQAHYAQRSCKRSEISGSSGLANSIGWFLETAMRADVRRRTRRASSMFPVLSDICPWRIPSSPDGSITDLQ
jgi:hypothetical protein